MQKCGFIARVHVASPHGHAQAPTWRGSDVALTWIHIIILMFNKYIGLLCIGRQIINMPEIVYIIYASFSAVYSVWD